MSLAEKRSEALGEPDPTIPKRPNSWLPLAALAFVLLGATVKAIGSIKDPDTFWHMATGQWLRGSWQFSGPDPWSAASTRTWTLHEWMPELLMGWTEQAFGLAGVAWLLPAAVAMVTFSVLIACRAYSSLLVSAVVTALAFLAMSGSLSLRPQLVTFALTAVFVRAWLRTTRDQRPRWWLVPLTWIWACSHGMWFMSVSVGVVVVTGITLGGGFGRRLILRLATIPLLSLISAALTPVGPRLLLSPFEVSGYGQYVTEWAPPTLKDIPFVAFLALVAIPLLVWARKAISVPWERVLLLGFGIVVGLAYTRTVAVGAAIVAPISAMALQSITGRPIERVSRSEHVLRLGSIALALAMAALITPSAAASPSNVPNALNETLDALPAGTVLCNDYKLGGWLIWRHSDLHPTIDGRTEIYSLEHVRSFMAFQAAAPGWQRYLSDNQCTYALLNAMTPVVEALKAQEDWREVRQADGYTLLRR